MTKTLHADLERDLRELFDRQQRAIVPSNRPWNSDGASAVAELEPPARGRRRRVALAAGLLAAAATIAAVLVAAGGQTHAVRTTPGATGTRSSAPRDNPSNAGTSTAPTTTGATGGSPPATEAKGAAEWDTAQVHLAVSGFSITTTSDAGTLVFTDSAHPSTQANANAAAPEVTVIGETTDPGAHQTIELRWTELGREQRLEIEFASDGHDWWATKMRTYDGQLPKSEWIAFDGERFRTPLGTVWRGSVDTTATDHGVTSRIRMTVEHLQAFITHG